MFLVSASLVGTALYAGQVPAPAEVFGIRPSNGFVMQFLYFLRYFYVKLKSWQFLKKEVQKIQQIPQQII